jgi:hypothetical protein
MNHCPEIEDLIASGPAAANLRRPHLDRCPRCRALLASYEEFLRGAPLPGMDAAAAASKMRASLEDAMRSEGLGRASGAPPAAERRNLLLLLKGLLHEPGLRPILITGATAVLVLVAAGVVTLRQRSGAEDEALLRGRAAGIQDPFTPRVSLEEGRDRMLFAWRPQAGADGYVLLFLRSDMSEAGRLDAGTDTSLGVTVRSLPGGIRSGEVLLWRVVALQDGDELDRSAAAGLRVP